MAPSPRLDIKTNDGSNLITTLHLLGGSSFSYFKKGYSVNGITIETTGVYNTDVKNAADCLFDLTDYDGLTNKINGSVKEYLNGDIILSNEELTKTVYVVPKKYYSPNHIYIKCSNNGRPQVKISTTSNQRLYAKIKTKDLINFTIAGVSYQAEEGMTWEDWVNSSYSTNGFFNDGYNILYNNVFVICKSSNITNTVEPSEIIISDSIYYLVNTSGGLSI